MDDNSIPRTSLQNQHIKAYMIFIIGFCTPCADAFDHFSSEIFIQDLNFFVASPLQLIKLYDQPPIAMIT